MSLRKFLVASAFTAAALLPLGTPVSAQTALRVGAAVTDAQGGEVGTITAVDGDFIVLRTDRHEARLPAASLTATPDAILFGMTRDQLNTQIDQLMAEAVTVGAVVRDRDGAVVGPVEVVDAQTLTVKFGERMIQLPRSAVVPGQGGLVIGATLADLQAQLAPASDATAGN